MTTAKKTMVEMVVMIERRGMMMKEEAGEILEMIDIVETIGMIGEVVEAMAVEVVIGIEIKIMKTTQNYS